MKLQEMVTASAADLIYFHPFVKDDKLYISGANIAKVPAMFAAITVADQSSKTFDQIRMVSVEGVRETVDYISKDASLLDWGQRLASLY